MVLVLLFLDLTVTTDVPPMLAPNSNNGYRKFKITIRLPLHQALLLVLEQCNVLRGPQR